MKERSFVLRENPREISLGMRLLYSNGYSSMSTIPQTCRAAKRALIKTSAFVAISLYPWRAQAWLSNLDSHYFYNESWRLQPASSPFESLSVRAMSSSNEEHGVELEKEVPAPPPQILPLENEDDNPIYGDGDEYCQLFDLFGNEASESYCEEENSGGRGFRWMRLEKETEPVVKELSEVVERIEQVRQTQSTLGQATLYPRAWEQHSFDGQVNGDAVINGQASSSSHSFSILQFNTLAEGLSSGPDDTVPFQLDTNDSRGQHEKQAYGGFTDLAFPAETLNFASRRWRLLEVLLGGGLDVPLDGSAYDLIALEEVDRHRGFFAPILQTFFGYKSIYAPKSRSPGVRMGWYSDGCVLFYKEDKFELLSEKRIEYKVGNQVFLLATLRHKASQRPLLVAVTHLKAQSNESNEKIRIAQVEELLQTIQEEVSIAQEQLQCPVPAIIAGDFNADPPHRCTYCEGGSAIARILQDNQMNFHSSYRQVEQPDDDNAFYTTWKKRGTTTTKRVIDFIFYTRACGSSEEPAPLLECEATLSIPSEEELLPGLLPCLRHPSDHMSIGAKFAFHNV